MATRKTPSSEPKASTPPAAPATAPAARSEAKGSGTAKAKPVAVDLSYDSISKRAYEIYASRGFAQGNPDEDWREAERQLKAGL